MSDTLTLYKLIILYMLSRVDFPLTRTQIIDFMLEKEYTTNYLTLQQAVGELIESGFVAAQPIRNRTHLTLTSEGRQTLTYFSSQIHYTMKEDIDKYFKAHEWELRNDVSILSDYTKTLSGEYEAHLVAKDKGTTLIDLKLSVPLEETAITICDNWQNRNEEIYQYLIGQLF